MRQRPWIGWVLLSCLAMLAGCSFPLAQDPAQPVPADLRPDLCAQISVALPHDAAGPGEDVDIDVNLANCGKSLLGLSPTCATDALHIELTNGTSVFVTDPLGASAHATWTPLDDGGRGHPLCETNSPTLLPANASTSVHLAWNGSVSALQCSSGPNGARDCVFVEHQAAPGSWTVTASLTQRAPEGDLRQWSSQAVAQRR